MEVSNFNVAIVSGGHMGEPTTIRITANILVESIADKAGVHDWAVAQAYIKHWLLDNNWRLVKYGKEEKHVTDYSREPGAAAILDWDLSIDIVWTPETIGLYLVPCRIVMFSNITVGDRWPPVWEYKFAHENPYGTIEITAPELQALGEDDFIVTIGENVRGYSWDGLVLSDPVDQTVTIGGHEIGVVIPPGTMILGTGRLTLSMAGGILTIDEPRGAIFSEYVKVTLDGELYFDFDRIPV